MDAFDLATKSLKERRNRNQINIARREKEALKNPSAVRYQGFNSSQGQPVTSAGFGGEIKTNGLIEENTQFQRIKNHFNQMPFKDKFVVGEAQPQPKGKVKILTSLQKEGFLEFYIVGDSKARKIFSLDRQKIELNSLQARLTNLGIGKNKFIVGISYLRKDTNIREITLIRGRQTKKIEREDNRGSLLGIPLTAAENNWFIPLNVESVSGRTYATGTFLNWDTEIDVEYQNLYLDTNQQNQTFYDNKRYSFNGISLYERWFNIGNYSHNSCSVSAFLKEQIYDLSKNHLLSFDYWESSNCIPTGTGSTEEITTINKTYLDGQEVEWQSRDQILGLVENGWIYHNQTANVYRVQDLSKNINNFIGKDKILIVREFVNGEKKWAIEIFEEKIIDIPENITQIWQAQYHP